MLAMFILAFRMQLITEQGMCLWQLKLPWLRTSLWIKEQLKQRLRVSLQWNILQGAG